MPELQKLFLSDQLPNIIRNLNNTKTKTNKINNQFNNISIFNLITLNNWTKINIFVIDGGYIDAFAMMCSNWAQIKDIGMIGKKSLYQRFSNKKLRENVMDVCLLRMVKPKN